MTLERPLFEISDDHLAANPGPDATAEELRALLRERGVRFLQLQFTDVTGDLKHLEVAERQFDSALAGAVMFDGSAIDGFARLEDSDLLLRPDPSTLRLLPWTSGSNRTAGVFCDVYRSEGTPFEGDPRGALRRVLDELLQIGFTANVGIEAKFILLERGADGAPVLVPHDRGRYLDPPPADRGSAVRRDVVNILDAMGFDVEAAHHEIAHGQHEIDFRFDDALATADKVALLRPIVRMVAHAHGLHASFMPKPIMGINGSGMHVHQSLEQEGRNVFHDPEAPHELSETMRFYIGGLLRHARGFCAITNPLVNSYKRFVPGYEAPVNIAWALQNRSAAIRVPRRRGEGTRLELRMPDPAANPYLTLAVQIAAGIDGIRSEMDPGEPVNKDIWAMSPRERQRLGIDRLPRSLVEALDDLEQDRVVRGALGEHIYGHFLQRKREEWREYISFVHPWEVERYLGV